MRLPHSRQQEYYKTKREDWKVRESNYALLNSVPVAILGTAGYNILDQNLSILRKKELP